MKKIYVFYILLLTLFSCKKDENKLDPILSFTVNARAAGEKAFDIETPSSTSDGSFTYTSSDPNVATISGNVATVVGPGSTTITAKQVATARYNEGTISTTFQVVPQGTYVLGQRIQGGIIYYVNAAADHGFMISDEDISTSAPWTNGSLAATGATTNSYGGGASNTDKIITALGEGTYAAKLCRDYRGGGFQDWYLPSTTELSLIRLRKDLIGGLAETNYWTSTEVSATVNTAQFIYFGASSVTFNGNTYTVTANAFNKTYTYSVRAVRAF